MGGITLNRAKVRTKRGGGLNLKMRMRSMWTRGEKAVATSRREEDNHDLIY
jgi:hypothetical protein